MGVAKFLDNFFKDCGVSLWLVWLCRIPCNMQVPTEQCEVRPSLSNLPKSAF